MKARHPLSAEELSLLAAIHGQPREHSVRLVYADWLESHGESDLAKLIRVQCEPPGTYTTHILRDGFRIGGQQWHNVGRWFRPLPKPLRFLYFSRGLPLAILRMPLATRAEWDYMFSGAHPRIRLHVAVTEGNELDNRLRHPLMGRADYLVVFGRNQLDGPDEARPLSGSAAQVIAASPFLERFSEITVVGGMDQEASGIFSECIPCRVRVTQVNRKRRSKK